MCVKRKKENIILERYRKQYKYGTKKINCIKNIADLFC